MQPLRNHPQCRSLVHKPSTTVRTPTCRSPITQINSLTVHCRWNWCMHWGTPAHLQRGWPPPAKSDPACSSRGDVLWSKQLKKIADSTTSLFDQVCAGTRKEGTTQQRLNFMAAQLLLATPSLPEGDEPSLKQHWTVTTSICGGMPSTRSTTLSLQMAPGRKCW
jgi:hypothetical protein